LAASGELSNAEKSSSFVVWNLKTKNLCGKKEFIGGEFECHSRGKHFQQGQYVATSVAFSPDNRYIVATGGNEVHLYEFGSDGEVGDHTTIAFGFEDFTYCGTFSPSGRWIMATSDDKTVRVWDVANNKLYQRFDHPDKVRQAVFSPDERLVLTGCHDGTARLWNLETGDAICCFEGHADQIEYGVAFSTKGDLIATGSYDKTVKIWRVPAKKTGRHT